MEVLNLNQDGKIGLSNGLNAAPTTPTYNLSFAQGGNAIIGMEATTAVDNGYSLTLRGSNAKSGATNALGGSASLSTGGATGNGGAKLEMYNVVSGQGTGTTARTPTLAVEIGDTAKFNRVVEVDNMKADTIYTEYAYIKNKAHGFYAFEDSAVVVDAVQDTWVHVANSTGNLFTAIQTDAGFIISGDTIYFNAQAVDGLFPHVVFHWGIDCFGGNNEDYEIRMYNIDNDEGIVRKAEGTTTGANNRIEIGTTSYDRHATFGDRYIMQVLNTTNSNDITLENGSIYLEVSHY
jgi:hypothetical protein